MRQVFLSRKGAIENLSLSWHLGDFARLCWSRGWVAGLHSPRLYQCCGEDPCVMPGAPFHIEFINLAS